MVHPWVRCLWNTTMDNVVTYAHATQSDSMMALEPIEVALPCIEMFVCSVGQLKKLPRLTILLAYYMQTPNPQSVCLHVLAYISMCCSRVVSCLLHGCSMSLPVRPIHARSRSHRQLSFWWKAESCIDRVNGNVACSAV